MAQLLKFSYWRAHVHPQVADYHSLERLVGSIVHAAGVPAPWHSIILNYLQACVNFFGLNDPVTAFEKLVQASKDFLKFFGSESSAWASPVCILFLQTLCSVGQAADRASEGHKHLEGK